MNGLCHVFPDISVHCLFSLYSTTPMSDSNDRVSRRAAVGLLAAVAGFVATDKGIGAAPLTGAALSTNSSDAPQSPGRLKQSFCRCPYARTPLAEVCRRGKEIGF